VFLANAARPESALWLVLQRKSRRTPALVVSGPIEHAASMSLRRRKVKNANPERIPLFCTRYRRRSFFVCSSAVGAMVFWELLAHRENVRRDRRKASFRFSYYHG
jgi:hypothetical protein